MEKMEKERIAKRESLCNMVFESGVVPEDWRSAMTVSLYKGKGEGTECKNYRGISLLSVVGQIYAGILIDSVHRVIGGLIDDEQGGFRARKGCVDQIFTLKSIGKKAREKKGSVCGFHRFLEGIQ